MATCQYLLNEGAETFEDEQQLTEWQLYPSLPIWPPVFSLITLWRDFLGPMKDEVKIAQLLGPVIVISSIKYLFLFRGSERLFCFLQERCDPPFFTYTFEARARSAIYLSLYSHLDARVFKRILRQDERSREYRVEQGVTMLHAFGRGIAIALCPYSTTGELSGLDGMCVTTALGPV